MSGRIRRAALAVFAVSAVALPAMARSLTTIVEPSHGPIQISACRANFDADQLTVSVDLNNTGEKAVSRVGLSFTVEDPFGQQLQYALRQREGDVSPGADVNNWPAWSVGLTGPIASNVGDVKCTLESVHFKDGSDWNAAADDSTNGSAPTPNPQGTP
jgi:hypothetical protein